MPALVKRGALFNNPRLPVKSPPEYLAAADDFARTDTPFPPTVDALGNTPTGGLQWIRLSTDGSTPAYAYGGAIVGGRMGLVAESLPSSRRIATYVNTGRSNGRPAMRLVSGVKDTTTAFLFRFVDMNNHLFLTIVSGKWALYKRVGGTGTAIYIPTGSHYANDGDIVDVVLDEAKVTPRVNGVSMPTQTITDFVTATRHGITQTLPTGTTASPLTLWDDFNAFRFGTWAEV